MVAWGLEVFGRVFLKVSAAMGYLVFLSGHTNYEHMCWAENSCTFTRHCRTQVLPKRPGGGERMRCRRIRKRYVYLHSEKTAFA